MEKIELSEEAKIYLRLIFLEEEFEISYKSQTTHLALLEYEGLIDNYPTNDDVFGFGNMTITNKGLAYLALNPTLKNPSLFDDLKHLSSSALTALSIYVSSQ